jgi:hypothetical protein
MASASSPNAGASRGANALRITAPAALVAACPDGKEALTVPVRSGPGSAIVSKGRGRSKVALSASDKRSAPQTQAAVKAGSQSGERFMASATPNESTIQTSPAFPIRDSATKSGSSHPTR